MGRDLRSSRGAHPLPSNHARLRQYPQTRGARRSSSRGASGRQGRAGPPRKPLTRAPAPRRGRAQAGRDPRGGGDGVARARDRRRHHRPRLPDRNAALDRGHSPAGGSFGTFPGSDAQGNSLRHHPRRAGGVRRSGRRHSQRRARRPRDSRGSARHIGAADRGRFFDRRLGRGRALRDDPARLSLPESRSSGLRVGGHHALRGHRDLARPYERLPPPRPGERQAPRPAQRPSHRHHLRRCHPRQRELLRHRRAGGKDRRDPGRGLRGREHGGGRFPSRDAVLAHPPRGVGSGAGRGRQRRGADGAVLAGRGAGANHRAFERGRRAAGARERASGAGSRARGALDVGERRAMPPRRGAARPLRRRGDESARRPSLVLDRRRRALFRRVGRHAARHSLSLRLAHQSRPGVSRFENASAARSTSSCRPRRPTTESSSP